MVVLHKQPICYRSCLTNSLSWYWLMRYMKAFYSVMTHTPLSVQCTSMIVTYVPTLQVRVTLAAQHAVNWYNPYLATCTWTEPVKH